MDKREAQIAGLGHIPAVFTVIDYSETGIYRCRYVGPLMPLEFVVLRVADSAVYGAEREVVGGGSGTRANRHIEFEQGVAGIPVDFTHHARHAERLAERAIFGDRNLYIFVDGGNNTAVYCLVSYFPCRP